LHLNPPVDIAQPHLEGHPQAKAAELSPQLSRRVDGRRSF